MWGYGVERHERRGRRLGREDAGLVGAMEGNGGQSRTPEQCVRLRHAPFGCTSVIGRSGQPGHSTHNAEPGSSEELPAIEAHNVDPTTGMMSGMTARISNAAPIAPSTCSRSESGT